MYQLFDKTKITRYSDLKNNDSLSAYSGMTAQQNHNTFELFHNLLYFEQVSTILEIGTSLGGFTEFLDYTSKLLELNCNIRSYDIAHKDWYENMKRSGIDVRVENIFSEDYQQVDSEVIDFIKNDGITIVLCDGGCKISEFHLLSKYLKPNDIIMAHDYAPNITYFREYIFSNIWNWMEISDADIEEACVVNNLIDFMKEELLSVAWVGKRKAV